MPFLRSANGSKMTFSQARLSALLSLVYQEAVGNKTPKYRAAIQKHCNVIWQDLEQAYGGADQDEWPGVGIYRHIEEELRHHADVPVHEAFLSMRINEFQEPKSKIKLTTPKTWDRFEAEVSEAPKLLPQDMIDPVWAIVLDRPPVSASSDLDKATAALSERMGFPMREKAAKNEKKQHTLPTRRSQWIGFWKQLRRQNSLGDAWDKHVYKIGLDQKHLSLENWWKFWQDTIDECMHKDPRVYELRRVLHERRQRARLTNQLWIEGTPLWEGEQGLRLEQTPTGQVWYKRFAIEHLKKVFAFTNTDWEWAALQKALKPERDQHITWRGWQEFQDAGALWSLQHTWPTGERTHDLALEMPQWAMMRMAMHLAWIDEDRERLTQNTIELYEQLSRQNFIPSAAVWREAGKENPVFVEDHTWFVQDNFLDIQKVIYESAVETVWTGTVASAWGEVRSKNAPVRAGRRKSTGVNDFLRTIDAHLRAQGRMGEERPVTVAMPCWHLDMEEFISLRHETAPRVQPVLLVTDLFMQRVAEGGVWTFFDPSVYPEVKDGTKGYTLAETKIAERKKLHPLAHKTVQADKMWKKLVGMARLGSPFFTFVDSDQCYSVAPERSMINGLDGVGCFPIFDDTQSQRISWPSMAVNISTMMSAEGEPLLEEWRESVTWAFWTAEKIYKVNQDLLSPESLQLRPLCLGAVGFYEAITKAMVSGNTHEDDVAVWVGKISEAWSALVTVIDQVFCQKYGPAPIWLTDSTLEPFHPKRNFERLKQQRRGGVGLTPPPEEISGLYDELKAHRFSVRTVWAPFKQLATWGGVSPGGFGTLFPVEWVMDDTRTWRLTPTNFLWNELEQSKDPETFGQIFSYPENPSKWPATIRRLSVPDMEEWKRRLKHAGIVRPWIEQGISLTLPSGLAPNVLSMILQQSWWMGLSNVRFEDPFKRPDMPKMDEADGDFLPE